MISCRCVAADLRVVGHVKQGAVGGWLEKGKPRKGGENFSVSDFRSCFGSIEFEVLLNVPISVQCECNRYCVTGLKIILDNMSSFFCESLDILVGYILTVRVTHG